MSTINELLNEQQQPKEQKASQTEKNMTLRAIDDYLATHQSETNNLAWHLHCLYRSCEGDDYGYNSSNVEFMPYFFDMLIKTFMIPKASKIFCDVSRFDAETLADNLLRLRNYFQEMMDCGVAKASMDRIEAGYFLFDKTSQELNNIRLNWLRQNEIDAAEKAAIAKYRSHFK